MCTYPNKSNELQLLKIITRDDEIKNLKYQTEKHDHENILKSLKVENENYKFKNKSSKKKKIVLIVTEILVGTGSAVGSSTMGLIDPGAGIIISSSTALLTSYPAKSGILQSPLCVCLFVCLFISRISHKLLVGF